MSEICYSQLLECFPTYLYPHLGLYYLLYSTALYNQEHKSICILIPSFLYYFIDFHLSLSFYFYFFIPLNYLNMFLPFCFYSYDNLCFILLSYSLLLLRKLTFMQKKCGIHRTCEIFLVLFLYSKQKLKGCFGEKQVVNSFLE